MNENELDCEWVERKLKPGAEVVISRRGFADWHTFRIVSASSTYRTVRLERRVKVDEILTAIGASANIRSALRASRVAEDDCADTTLISFEAMTLSEDLIMDRTAVVYELLYPSS